MTNKQQIPADLPRNNNNKSMSGDYYVVNYSTNDDASSSTVASSNKEKNGATKLIPSARKKSKLETVKIEKKSNSLLKLKHIKK